MTSLEANESTITNIKPQGLEDKYIMNNYTVTTDDAMNKFECIDQYEFDFETIYVIISVAEIK